MTEPQVAKIDPTIRALMYFAVLAVLLLTWGIGSCTAYNRERSKSLRQRARPRGRGWPQG